MTKSEADKPGDMMPPGQLLHALVTMRGLSGMFAFALWSDLDASQRQQFNVAAAEFQAGVEQYHRQHAPVVDVSDEMACDPPADSLSSQTISEMLYQHEQGLAEHSYHLKELDARVARLEGDKVDGATTDGDDPAGTGAVSALRSVHAY